MYMAHGSLDVGAAFARSSLFLRGRGLENGEQGVAAVGIVIDGE